MIARYETVQKRLDAVAAEKQSRNARKERTLRFLDTLRQNDNLITAFDEDLWCATVDTVTVHSGKEFTILFKNGDEMRAEIFTFL